VHLEVKMKIRSDQIAMNRTQCFLYWQMVPLHPGHSLDPYATTSPGMWAAWKYQHKEAHIAHMN